MNRLKQIMEFAMARHRNKDSKEKDRYFCQPEIRDFYKLESTTNITPAIRKAIENGGIIQTMQRQICLFGKMRRHHHYCYNNKPDRATKIEDLQPEVKEKLLTKMGRPQMLDPEVLSFIEEHKQLSSRKIQELLKTELGKDIHYNTINRRKNELVKGEIKIPLVKSKSLENAEIMQATMVKNTEILALQELLKEEIKKRIKAEIVLKHIKEIIENGL